MRKTKLIVSLLAAVAAFAGGGREVVAQPAAISVELIKTFDFTRPGYTFLSTGQLNDGGTFVLQLLQGSAAVAALGNVDGTFARPFVEPDQDVGFTSASGINNAGVVCGRYDQGGTTHGFLKHRKAFKSYDAPVAGETATTVDGINDARDFCGIYTAQSGSEVHAYALIGGTFITIPISGFTPEASAINNLDEVVGSYGDSQGFYGFLRAADGTLTLPIIAPGASQTVPMAINDAGYFVGYWADNRGAHAFVMHLPDTFVSYDMPGATGTSFTGINSDGLIVGNFQDQQHKTHGLVMQLLVE